MAFSGALHPLLAVVYEELREPYRPRLRVEVRGDGSGSVQAVWKGERERARSQPCGEGCDLRVTRKTAIRLVATVGEGSTFEGWEGPCGPQGHRLFRWAEGVLASDPLEPALADYLGVEAAEPAPPSFPLECELAMEGSATVAAIFGRQPEEIEMEYIAESELAPLDSVALPDPREEAESLFEEPEQEPPLQAMIPPPEPPPPTEPPPPPEERPEPTANMKAVEVPDKNESAEAPADARFLSDKNRDVAEETRALDTNLERESDGEVAASAPSPRASEEVGAAEEEIAELEEVESSSREALEPESRAREERAAAGEGGRAGAPEAADSPPQESPGALSMRGIAGRGSLGAAEPDSAPPAEGRPGAPGRPGLKTELEAGDYESIVGAEVAANERRVARSKRSVRQGRWEKKLGLMKSSLENFTPEVRPGNQTALKTRAAPFAVFIARMHRTIHELWGFGFLEDLAAKGSNHEMNDWTLWTKLEIVIKSDGSIDALTIVKPSGVLPFDVAAMDAVYTGGPYESPPPAIRSSDGKTYLHWSFHRDWRQCGTFGAEPFILDKGAAASRVKRGASTRSGTDR